MLYPDPLHPSLAPSDAAPQHGPRPLPHFLRLVADAAQHDAPSARRALEGLRVYQAASRPVQPPVPEAIAQRGRVRLRDYGGNGPPVIFVPSLINPPHILDLAHGRSLLRWLSTQGLRPLLIDWGSATPEDRAINLAGHVEEWLVPLIDAVGEPAALAGYCLGGTLALAAAVLRPPRALALIATPWNFAGFGEAARVDLAALWRDAGPTSEALGLLPMEVLQTGFWHLDPARTVEKYAQFADLPPDSDAAARFVAMEDWANGGSPIPHATAADMFERLFATNVTGRTEWAVGGVEIDPARIACPVLDVVSTADRIVPAASAAGIGTRREIAQGHVGMIAGSKAESALWHPLAAWLKEAI